MNLMIVMLADLIPHGSQQVSHRVSFIGPEPPQVWGTHGGGGGRRKKKHYRFIVLHRC